MTNINKIDVVIPVKLRKYAVDIEALKTTLRDHKKKEKITNAAISKELNKPITLVEHWFRRDKSFSIPDADTWHELKKLLNIETDYFDISIMTFEECPGAYDQRNRVYLTNGVAPTLTTGGEVLIFEGVKNSYKKLKVNDLFCGAGGMGIGFKYAGFDIAGAWDFDKYAVESYKHNVGDHVEQADITEMKGEDLPNADVFTFGFPCQDLSKANNNRKGFEGKRSKLFFEVMRLLDERKEKGLNLPKVIMAENVDKLIDVMDVLESEYTKRDYKMYYKLYNAKFWGVPQSRLRYFVVGVHKSIEKDFFFPEQQDVYVPKLDTILDENVNDKYFMPDSKAESVLDGIDHEKKFKSDIKVIGRIDIKGIDQIKRVYDVKGVAPTLTTCEGGHRQPKVLIDGRIRKLNPREFARGQGFPEEYEIVVSDSQAYKQFGNAVTVNIAQALAERIKVFLFSL